MRRTRARLARAACHATTWALLGGCYFPSSTVASRRALSYFRAREGRPSSVAAPRELTVERSIAIAKANSAAVAEKRAHVAVARAHVRDVAEIDNPEVRVGQMRLDRITENLPEVEVKVRVKPPRPIRNQALEAEARAELRGAEADVRAEEARVEAEVRLAFATIRILEGEQRARQSLLDAKKRAFAIIDGRVAQSRATALERTSSRADVAMAEEEVAEVNAQRARAIARLSDLIGTPLEGVTIEGAPVEALEVAGLPKERELVEKALAQAPALDKSAARIDAFEARTTAEQSLQWPWFSYLDLGYDFSHSTLDGLGWTFGAGVILPIFDTNRAGVDEAKASKVEAERAFDAVTQDLVVEVRGRARDLDDAGKAIERFRTGPLATANQARRDAAAALEAGQIDDLTMADTEVRAAQAELRLLTLVRRYVDAVAALQRLTGWAPPL